MNFPTQAPNQLLRNADATIQERITRFLHNANLSAFKDLLVDATDGVVTLRGSTQSFYHKQLALTYSKTVAKNYSLVDQVVVQN